MEGKAGRGGCGGRRFGGEKGGGGGGYREDYNTKYIKLRGKEGMGGGGAGGKEIPSCKK